MGQITQTIICLKSKVIVMDTRGNIHVVNADSLLKTQLTVRQNSLLYCHLRDLCQHLKQSTLFDENNTKARIESFNIRFL